jgi:phage terminase large subunit-like protein
LWARQSRATKAAALGDKWRKFWAGLNTRKKAALKCNWAFWARPAQQIPIVTFFVWLILAGRGWGKTRTGAAFVIQKARQNPKSRGALIGATASDVRDTMILGDSGIIASSPPDFLPTYEPSKRLLRWPNGSQAICYTADQPNRLRGPNLDWAWCDELAAWRYVQQAWDMLMYCMRKGKNPQVCVTTTPRPIPLVLELVADADDPKKATILTKGSSWDNFWNLSKTFFRQLLLRAKGALARQEVFADILQNVEGALWSLALIEKNRVYKLPELSRIVVAVDPATMDGPDNDETGIVACGKDWNEVGYVLDDASCKGTPQVWARRAYELWLRLDADAIVVETNRGGQMVAHTVRSVIREGEPRPRIIEVTATKGKKLRAEPIVALWEEGRFKMLGALPGLETEQTTWVPGLTKKSPNRLDAKIWAAHALFPVWAVHN